MQVQQVLSQNPFDGAVFAFRGRGAGLIKLLWYDGIGMCLLTKRLERGHFIWPMTSTGKISLTASQLATLLEGCEWRGAGISSWQPKKVLAATRRHCSSCRHADRPDRPARRLRRIAKHNSRCRHDDYAA